jgi:exonuclease SbcC
MIKQLSITNFQSHRDTSLDFVDGVNVIVGESDSGKSAILRALRWCIWNRPTGDAMRSWWGGKTSVEIFTDDAHVVRLRDKENEYILGDSHFKAVSTDVPQEVAQVLNLNEINLQTQLSQPFLLSNSAGEVAQFFNKVAHLEKIDTATQKINSAIRELTTDIKYKDIEIGKQEEELKQYEHLEKFEAEVEALEELDKQYLLLIQKEAKISNLIESIKDTTAQIKEYLPMLDLEETVDKLLKSREENIQKFIERTSLAKLLNAIKSNQLAINRQNELLKLEPDVIAIFTNMEKQDQLEMKLGDFAMDVNELVSIDNRIFAAENLIKVLQKQFDKEIGDVCPLCGQTIKRK